jgi:predicted ABC-type ATPase
VTEGRPWLVIVGGINGAGKSTFAESRAQDPSLVGAVFLNPDHAISAVLAARKSLIAETVFANETRA